MNQRAAIRPESSPSDHRHDRLLLAVLFLLCFAIRSLLSVFPKVATTYGDELLYLELAQNMWLRGSLTVYALPVQFSKLLYPLLLAPFYAISDPGIRLSAISVFNALLVSSALFPAYLLARRFLKNRIHLWIVLLILASSPNLCFSMTYMAENLYIPLFLWAFYFLMCMLDRPEQRPAFSLLVGFFSFLLYFTKEAGIAFLLAVLSVYIHLLYIRKPHKSAFLALGMFLAGALIPYGVCHFFLFPSTGYSYQAQLSLGGLSSLHSFTFLLCSALVMMLYLLATSLFFPVMIPLVRRRKMNALQRHLLLSITVYLFLIALGTAYAVSVPEDFGSDHLRVHLRYFLPILFPYLLLFLSCLEDQNSKTTSASSADRPSILSLFRSPLSILTLLFILLFLLLPGPLTFGSLVDAPSLYAVTLFPSGSIWFRIIFVVLCAFALGLWIFKSQRAFLGFLLPALLITELASGLTFSLRARIDEGIPSVPSIAEVQLLDQTLDQLNGNVLVIRDDIHLPSERMMDTWTDDDYYVVHSAHLKNLSFLSSQPGSILLKETVLPTPVKYFVQPTPIDSIDYLITASASVPVSSHYNTDITPEGLHTWRIYQASDPSLIHLQDSSAYNVTDYLTFFGDQPTYLNYITAGFSVSEPSFTWNNGTSAAILLSPSWDSPTDLTGELSLAATIGEQTIQIYANELLLYDGKVSGSCVITFPVPSEVFASERSPYGNVTFKILLPDSVHPDNGDPRQLGVAFLHFVMRYAQ